EGRHPDLPGALLEPRRTPLVPGRRRAARQGLGPDARLAVATEIGWRDLVARRGVARQYGAVDHSAGRYEAALGVEAKRREHLNILARRVGREEHASGANVSPTDSRRFYF